MRRCQSADYLELMDFIKIPFGCLLRKKIRVAYNPYLRASFMRQKAVIQL